MKRKLISSILAAAMAVGLCACGSGNDTQKSGGDSKGGYDQVTYAYATFNNIPTEEDLDAVEEAINEITREKINAEITLKPISIGDYSSTISRSLQADEKIDIFQAIGDFNNCVNTGMSADLTEMIDTCAAQTKELIGDEWLEACSFDGKVYGLPTYKPVALTPMVIYRKDIADELKLDMDSIQSVEQLTPILEQVKEAYPDIVPLAPVQAGTLGMELTYGNVDWLSDDYNNPVGVLFGDDMTVVDFYSSKEFADKCNLAKEWNDKGLSMKDAATTTSTSSELMSSGNYFCYVASYSYPEEDTAASLQAQSGSNPVGAKIIGNAYLNTTDINGLTWMVASNSKVPEAALKFLNLTFTDADVCNALVFGIEGRDYVLDEEGYAAYPEGQEAASVPYTAQLSCGTLGNFFLMYPTVGVNKESLEWELEQNQTAATSPAMGFTVDSSSLKTQYTAVLNVINQYLPGLRCGSVDPATEIPKFVEALNQAGYQDILSAKQEQLDSWMAENK
ncbi:MAG: ABC transporter substrate-binding protein [Eubacterium sp.]|nr:ABC transporter substrate-binding protein [Eubacterium sp.]